MEEEKQEIRIHPRHLRLLQNMFEIRDNPKKRISDKVLSRVKALEARNLRYFSNFREVDYEVIAALVLDIPDEDAVVDVEEPKEPVVDYTQWKREDMMNELSKRGTMITGKEKRDDMIAMLVNSDKV